MATTKISYTSRDHVAIAGIDPFFGPDAPPLPDAEPPTDLMQQNPDIIYALQVWDDLVVGERLDVFMDTNSIVYYDPANHNRRVQPDVYIAFGVDVDAIRRRNGYVIWEVGKPPDFVLEVASESTAGNDTGWKRDLYARLGVQEYWRFDTTGGDLYGTGLVGEYLEGTEYRPVNTHVEPDGVEWAYSALLHMNLRWHDARLELQDPDTREVLVDRRGVRLALEAELSRREDRIRDQDQRIRQLEERLNQRELPEA